MRRVALVLVSAVTVGTWTFLCSDVLSQPLGVVTADVGFPAVGTKWTVRTVDRTGAGRSRTWTVLPDDTYKTIPVHRISSDQFTRYYDVATSNIIARLRDGKEIETFSPHLGSLSWPLRVGRSWTARYVHWRADSRESFPASTEWKVAAYEDVQVPAGTFPAFRLEGKNPFFTGVFWYAPQLKMAVKFIEELYVPEGSKPRQERFVEELVEYVAR